MEQLSAIDTQMHWLAPLVPSDQFLLYGFAGATQAMDVVADTLLDRARQLADLTVRVREVPFALDHPWWVRYVPGPERIRWHGDDTWGGVLDAVGAAMADQVDATRAPWRLHLWGPIDDLPGAEGERSVVAVLQLSHAVADGSGAAAIARDLFLSNAIDRPFLTTSRPVPGALLAARGLTTLPVDVGRLVVRGVGAFRAHRAFEADVRRESVRKAPPGAPLTSLNTRPDGRRQLRVVPTTSDRLRAIGGTVTVGALTVVSVALQRYLASEDPSRLTAEVGMRKSGQRYGRNHFRNVGVDLRIDEATPEARARAIASDLGDAVARMRHRSTETESHAHAATPAVLLRRMIDAVDLTARPDTMTGNTVVSSVDRGPADLTLGGGRVVLTAGFPSLSPMQTLTHGVHGIGSRVALSVLSSPAGVPDPDRYTALLAAALA